MEKEKRIKIFPLYIEDMFNAADFEFIDNTLEAKQKFVGGLIQGICFDRERKLDLICNDDGKIMGLPANRVWVMDNKVVDIIAGEAFICRHDGDEYCSIREEDKEIVLNTFRPIIGYKDGHFLVVNADDTFEVLEMYKG